MLFTNIVECSTIILESSVEEVIKSVRNLTSSIRCKNLEVIEHYLVNPALREGDIKIFAPMGLKDTEARALAIYTLVARDSLAAWKVQEFLEQYSTLQRNPQLGLLLNCRSLEEAVYRLSNIDQSILTKIYRNYSDNLKSGLRKLRIFKGNKKVKFPQRKRGYNDKGSIDPDSAWKRARAFWLDDIDQRKIEYRRQAYNDAIAFLDGFTE